MQQNCLNCGAVLTENYCARCGQKSAVKRLNWDGFVEEVFHFFTHIEKGFLKTTIQLIVHPGSVMKNYLDGKRKIYHKPISFFIIWVAIYLVVYNLGVAVSHYPNATTGALFSFDAKSTVVLNKYRTLIEILIIPLIAFIDWLIVARPKLYYIEILSVFFYITSFFYMLLIVLVLCFLLLNLNFRTDLFNMISPIAYISWAAYAAYDFFRNYAIRFLVVRLTLAIAVGVSGYFFLVNLIIKLLVALHVG
ncbi:MAG TPA: DUF3667 domain-containing protein [Chitinophagaceae bacterium]|nr:DUF3667 domain-containing protein [Chitinophagaceae bacterium]